MATQHPDTAALRQRFNTSPLARMGWQFEAAMAVPAIATAIQCGARESARAAQINRTRPHWSDTQSSQSPGAT